MATTIKKLSVVTVILFVILIVLILLSGSKKGISGKESLRVYCEDDCMKMDNDEWQFETQTFYSQEDCIFACQHKMK